MRCENKAEVWVERGYSGKMVELPCGSTGPHGIVELCMSCLAKQTQIYPQGWRHRPGDICKHGTYINPEHDCCCAACEEGIPASSEYKCHCGARLEFLMGEEDELECPKCDMLVNLPETEEQRIKWLAEINKEIEAARYTGRIRVMRIDECGNESHVITIKDDEAAQYVIAGVEAAYPESKVFTEPEENQRYVVEQFLLDNEF